MFDDVPEDAGLAAVAHLEGCAELAAWLSSVDVTALGDHDLVEVVAAFERVAAWAKARSALAAAELAERPSMNPAWPSCAGRVSERCVAGTELSLRLGISRRAAGGLVEVGRALAGPQVQTGAALERGEIDWGKARLIVEALADVPLPVSLEAEAAVLPAASGRTHPQLRRDVQRALVELDPRDAQERHERARLHRRVDRPRVLPDGMAAVSAVLPAESAVRLDAVLQAAATAAHHDGDRRTTDQLRADALDAMAGVAWDTGWIGPCPTCRPGVASSIGAAPPAGAVTIPKAMPSGGGMSSAGAVGSGAMAFAGSMSSAGMVVSGGGTSSAGMVGSGATASVIPAPTGLRLGTGGGRRAQVQVTVGIGTLLGLDDRPAELGGYGSITADVARRIAADGTWRRLLVDEPTGTVLDVGRRSYRPPPDMAELVRARDRTCVVPTCSVPADRCDLDHTVPFERPAGGAEPRSGTPARTGGRTAADNLGALCSTHHLGKTHGGFRLEQPHGGTFLLQTPTGHSYRRQPARPAGVPGGLPAGPLREGINRLGGDRPLREGTDRLGGDGPGTRAGDDELPPF